MCALASTISCARRHLVERNGGMHDRADRAVGDQRPGVLLDTGDDRCLLARLVGPAASCRSVPPACASATPRSSSAFAPPCSPMTTSRPSVASTSTLRARYLAPMLSRMTSAPAPSAKRRPPRRSPARGSRRRGRRRARGRRVGLLGRPTWSRRSHPAPCRAGSPSCRCRRRRRAPAAVSSGWSAAIMKTLDHTVQTTSGRAAASTRSRPAGTGSTWPAGRRPARRSRPSQRAHDPVADLPPVDAVADSGHDAGALQAEDVGRAGRRRVDGLGAA